MNKGMIRRFAPLLLLLLPLSVSAAGEIYKVTDKDGNVTYTDQRPGPDARPVDLPPLSVVETDIDVPEKPAPGSEAAGDASSAPTLRELRRQFRDYRIITPKAEETFWGTANTVVVSWGTSKPVPQGMTGKLFVDGEARAVPAAGSVSLTLDRGEHSVYAVLYDERKRRIATTPTVTFFVKQYSANFNRPGPTPRGSGP